MSEVPKCVSCGWSLKYCECDYGAKLAPHRGRPPNPFEGMVYFDLGDQGSHVYLAGGWMALATADNLFVAVG